MATRSFDSLLRDTATDGATVDRLHKLAYWLDDRYRIPGTSRRVGLDGLIGLVPGIGDAATTVMSAYIVLEAWRLGIPKRRLAQMGINVGIDSLVGAVPLVGDLFDMTWKANRRNVQLVLEHLESQRRLTPSAPGHRSEALRGSASRAGESETLSSRR